MKYGKQQWAFWVGLIVAVLLIGTAVALLVTSMKAANEAGSKLDTQLEKLQWFYRQRPYPSTNNVAEVAAQAQTVEHWADRLIEAAREGQLLREQRTPPIFMQELGNTRQHLLKRARDGVNEVVSERFNFGFDSYFEAGGALPRFEMVPDLLIQLRVIRAISLLLIDEGIIQLQAVKREEVTPPQSPQAAGKGTKKGEQDPLTDAGVSTMTFTFEFLTRETALVNALNRLAALDMFVVVTKLDLKKQGEDLMDADRLPATEPGETVSRMQRLVAGAEIESPMQVEMSLAVYRFREGVDE